MENRFEQVHFESLKKYGGAPILSNIGIIKDTETGVMYGMTVRGIFPLLDVDGKPLLDKPE